MPVKQSDFEILLAKYSDRTSAIALLKQYRPYLGFAEKVAEKIKFISIETMNG
ncbi:MAG: hypothetical protein QNJ41_18755 [Xenococcaceae cyanobacterium MO_188.B32]|nr:hypothetical protein [Xenococcaceae cyanobacterium MO_188.B32]